MPTSVAARCPPAPRALRWLHMCGGQHAWLAERAPELLATMVANLQLQRRRNGAEQSAALAELKRELLRGLHAVAWGRSVAAPSASSLSSSCRTTSPPAARCAPL